MTSRVENPVVAYFDSPNQHHDTEPTYVAHSELAALIFVAGHIVVVVRDGLAHRKIIALSR